MAPFQRELVEPKPVDGPTLTILAKPQTALKSTGPSLQDILAEYGAVMAPQFAPVPTGTTAAEPSLSAATSATASPPASTAAADNSNLDHYHRVYVNAPADKLEALAAKLLASGTVDGAYVKPAGVPPRAYPQKSALTMPPPATTPSWQRRQLYLEAAPIGFDATWAATLPGGRGAGVSIIDCEWGWETAHEDLKANFKGVTNKNDTSDTDHGTSVVGILTGDSNPYGITGICPDAETRGFGFGDWPVRDNADPVQIMGASVDTAKVVRDAAKALSPGDILLLEIHLPGPRSKSKGQYGFLPVEWWPDEFDAIRFATDKGVIVVEAAGNGSQGLDDDIYDKPGGFGKGWANPFRPGNRQSGAIMVGAGEPRLRERMWFSNYGARVDVHGWGENMYTTGGGDLQGGPDPTRWYTAEFAGTSSASPCVAGCLAVVQGVLRARGRRRMTPAEAKYWLRRTGPPQKHYWPPEDGKPPPDWAEDQEFLVKVRIGNRPNLRHLIPAAAAWACRSADFDGDGKAEVLVTSANIPGNYGIALLKKSPGTPGFVALAQVANGAKLAGGWTVNTVDTTFGPVADFDGDAKAEVFVSNPACIGILKLSTGANPTFSTTAMHANKAQLAGGWTLDTAENNFGPAGDFDGDGSQELLVTGPQGLGILKQTGNALRCVLLAKNGDKLFGAQAPLNTADNDFSLTGRFSGAGKKAELFVVASWGVAVLQAQATGAPKLMCAVTNGTKIGPGGWTLQTGSMRFGHAGDYDGDGKDELVVTGPLGVAVLKLVGANLTVLAYAADGAALGSGALGWPLRMAENNFGPARDFDGDKKAELLVTGPKTVGILKVVGGSLVPLAVQTDSEAVVGGWPLNLAKDWFGSAARYGETEKAGVLVSGSTGVGILEYAGSGAFTTLAMVRDGAKIGGWTLDIAADNLGHGV